MTMTPREIQEKQFHDAFRGYNHEEVDLFLDQVAEAYEALFSENRTYQERLEVLQDQPPRTAEATQSIETAPAAPAPEPERAPSALRSDSEDMLKRMLVTAQETADKAVANARAKAQMIVDDAEIKARRIEEQADAVSSTALQDAQRKAREMIQTAQKEEAELRDRIDGMRTFEREFRSRLSAFIRSQLELLETKPLVSAGIAGPVSTPFFDRSKLLGDYPPAPAGGEAGRAGEGEAAPEPTAGEREEKPEPRRRREEEADDRGEPAGSAEKGRPTAEDSAGPPAPAPGAEEPPREAGGDDAGAEPDRPAPSEFAKALEEDSEPRPERPLASDSKSIHDLFWGDD